MLFDRPFIFRYIQVKASNLKSLRRLNFVLHLALYCSIETEINLAASNVFSMNLGLLECFP